MAEGGTGDDHLKRAQRACGEKRSKLGEGEGEGRTKGGLGGRRGIELSRIPLALAVWRRRSRVGCAIPDRESSSVKGRCLDIHSIPSATCDWYLYVVPVCLFSICQLIRAIELAWWWTVSTCPSCLRALAAARHACITGGNSTSTLTTTLSPWSTCLYREEKTMNNIL
jgi:hypothetical protein